MPVNHDYGRYVLAAVLLTLEAPILFVLVAGTALSVAVLAVNRAVQNVARSVAGTQPQPRHHDPGDTGGAPEPTPLGHGN